MVFDLGFQRKFLLHLFSSWFQFLFLISFFFFQHLYLQVTEQICLLIFYLNFNQGKKSVSSFSILHLNYIKAKLVLLSKKARIGLEKAIFKTGGKML